MIPLFATLAAGPALAQGGDVNIWLTRGDKQALLAPQHDAAFAPGGGATTVKIRIDPNTTYQEMEGFGAAMTDTSAWLIQNRLNPAQRDRLMTDLFSTTGGIGLNYLRVPMGASDFALTPYTYNDLPAGQTDPDLEHFSIAHDEAYIIPTLQEAQRANPGLKLMASPWSAPAWMKTNGSLNGGSLRNEWLPTYADYFVRFIEAYQAHGLPIDALSVQNEPLHTADYPTMAMSTFQQSTLIGDHLGPKLAAAGIDTKILAFDHNWSDWNDPVVVMNDPEAAPFIAGAAFHGYAGSVDQQSLFQDFFPDKGVYFTEISGGDFAPSFSDNLVWNMRNIVIGATRNWAKTALWWNIALDENHGPKMDGGCSDCRGVVTIDSATGGVTFNEEFYSLAHASKFVVPGAVRIASDTIEGVIETVAFANPDGSMVLIALNPSNRTRAFDVLLGEEAFSYNLAPQSVATFTWSGPAQALLGDLNGDGCLGARLPVLKRPLPLHSSAPYTARRFVTSPGASAWARSTAGSIGSSSSSRSCRAGGGSPPRSSPRRAGWPSAPSTATCRRWGPRACRSTTTRTPTATPHGIKADAAGVSSELERFVEENSAPLILNIARIE